MEERWLFSLFCFLWVPSITGQSRDVLTETEVVSALPGTDVTLVCLFPKSRTTHIIQTQWSKTEDSQSTKIAVHHPIYGTHYFKFSKASYNFSVSFSTRKCCSQDVTESLCSTNPNAPSECNQWALHLKNVTIALSGQYECSFATYPYGTKAAKIQLIVKAEEEQHYLKKVWLNQTLEIPCLEDTISEDLSTYPLKWLVGDNNRKEELVTKEPSCPAVYRNSSSVYGQRVRLGLNNTLKIFPTKITDDGKVFSCHVRYHPERVQKSSTTVRVYAYPEISVSLQEGSAGTSQKPSVSCVVRKAFPKPSLVWYVDRVNLLEQPGEILVVQEDLQDSEGFYQMRSTLVLQGTQETHKTFSCACLFSSLGSETWNISSEEIFVSFDNKSNEASSEAFTTTVSEEPQSTSLASLDFTSQANLAPASTTKDLNDSTTESSQSLSNATRSSENTTLTHGNLFYRITDQTISVTKGKDFFTASSLLNSTGERNTNTSRFPWPTVVAVLLLFCSSLIAVGIRKWCQYQKEIMNRPPSFKPPPPPIKYTSMVESDGTAPSCHELENL
ncbi:T-cell surface protein tactile isoform X2 [Myiozetetes cayanensis]|uniref:T-cell surface protein tactile isoform X2 n=1 Tax=Myiozetetes cayanensis TaxID=478635 RepID=UPI00215E6B0E|nr:T-cell surface protein tactile isoform X2 [Myiozetetes cayanensis]